MRKVLSKREALPPHLHSFRCSHGDGHRPRVPYAVVRDCVRENYVPAGRSQVAAWAVLSGAQPNPVVRERYTHVLERNSDMGRPR